MSGTEDAWTDAETLVGSQRLAGGEAAAQLSPVVSAGDIQEAIAIKKGRIDYKFSNLKEDTGLNWTCFVPTFESEDWRTGLACDTDPFLGKKSNEPYCFASSTDSELPAYDELERLVNRELKGQDSLRQIYRKLLHPRPFDSFFRGPQIVNCARQVVHPKAKTIEL